MGHSLWSRFCNGFCSGNGSSDAVIRPPEAGLSRDRRKRLGNLFRDSAQSERKRSLLIHDSSEIPHASLIQIRESWRGTRGRRPRRPLLATAQPDRGSSAHPWVRSRHPPHLTTQSQARPSPFSRLTKPSPRPASPHFSQTAGRCGARAYACRVETLLDTSSGADTASEAERRQEWRRGTQKCVRHIIAQKVW